MTRKLYSIANWNSVYEYRDSKAVKGPLPWVAVPTKQDGLGMRKLAAHRDRCELFSAFILMVEIAAKQPQGERGRLARNGTPLDAEDLSAMTGFPSEIFEKAFTYFTDPKQGWMNVEEQNGVMPQQEATRPVTSASAAPARAGDAPEGPAPNRLATSGEPHAAPFNDSPPTAHCRSTADPPTAHRQSTDGAPSLQDRTGQDITGQDKTPRAGARDAAAPLVFPASLDTKEFHEAWKLYVQYRRTRKPALAPLSEISTRLQLEHLETLGEKEAIKKIKYSIRQNYIGLIGEPPTGGSKGEARPMNPAQALAVIRQLENEVEDLRCIHMGPGADEKNAADKTRRRELLNRIGKIRQENRL